MIIGFPVFCALVWWLWHKRNEWLLIKPIETISNEIALARSLNFHLQLVDNFDEAAWSYYKHAFISFHKRRCRNDPRRNCICSNFNSTEPNRSMGYSLLEAVLEEKSREIPKNKDILFAQLYVSLFRRKNIFKASLIYQRLISGKNSLQYSVTLSKIGEIIQDHTVEYNKSRQASTTPGSVNSKSTTDIDKFLQFEKSFYKFQESMVVVCQIKETLLEEIEFPMEDPKGKIDLYSELIYQKSGQISNLFQYLNNLRPDSIPLLMVYIYYTLLVLNLKSEAKKASLKIRANREESERSLKTKYGYGKPMKGIISISMEATERGKITLVDQYVLTMLNYNREELVGKNLSEILPDHLTKRHDQFLESFGQSEDSSVINHRRLRFFVNRDGFLVPIILEVRFHFTVNSGIEMVGLIYEYMTMVRYQLKSKLRYYLTYNQATGDIGYVCKNCSFYLGF